jgi:hypothetical protein
MLKVNLFHKDKENPPKLIDFGKIKLTSPIYSQIIETSSELELAQKTKKDNNLQNSSLHVIGILDINRILTKKSATLHKFLGSSKEFKLDSHNGLIIDPQFEYLYHKVKSERKEFSQLNGIPKIFQDLLKGNYKSKILTLMNSPEKIKLIEWAMTLPMEEFDALFPLPPSLPIKGMTSLEHSLEINRIGITTAKDNGWHESFFFNLDSQKCFSDEILRTIFEFIKLNENDANTIVIKLRNGIRPLTPYEMASFLNFCHSLNQLRKDKAVMLLNTDSFGLLGMGLGDVDILAEPLSGQLNKDIRNKKDEEAEDVDYKYDPEKVFGKWLNPKDLAWWKFKDLKVLVEHNKNKLPCTCRECTKVDLRKIFKDSFEYNLFRRRHTILFRDEQMEQIRHSMVQNNLRGAFFEKLNSNEMMYSPFVQYKGWFR